MNRAPPISAEYRAALHRELDKAIDDLQGRCDVEVRHGTKTAPNEQSGMMETSHNGVVTITIKPSGLHAELLHKHYWRDVPGDPGYRICDVCLAYERAS